MNKLFGLVLIVILLIGGVGFYRGWFSVATRKSDAEGNKFDLNLTVDPDKINSDKDAVREKMHELTDAAQSQPGETKEDVGKVDTPVPKD